MQGLLRADWVRSAFPKHTGWEGWGWGPVWLVRTWIPLGTFLWPLLLPPHCCLLLQGPWPCFPPPLDGVGGVGVSQP